MAHLLDVHSPGNTLQTGQGRGNTYFGQYSSVTGEVTWITMARIHAASSSFGSNKVADPDGFKQLVLQNLPELVLQLQLVQKLRMGSAESEYSDRATYLEVGLGSKLMFDRRKIRLRGFFLSVRALLDGYGGPTPHIMHWVSSAGCVISSAI